MVNTVGRTQGKHFPNTAFNYVLFSIPPWEAVAQEVDKVVN